MALSNRTKEIIRILLNQGGYITIEELAVKVGVSQRTMYRELPEVSAVMEQFGVVLLTASKKGITASGNEKSILRLRRFLGEIEEVEIVSPEEREDYILLYLLHQTDYIKMEALAIDHQCALSTVRNDMQKIKQKLSRYELQLIQQKGQGVKINGMLMEKNHCIVDILLKNADEPVIYRWSSRDQDESNPFLCRVEEYGYRKTVQKMHGCLKEILRDSDILPGLKTREYLEIILLLSYMIYYHERGQAYHRYMEERLEEQEHALAIEVVHRIQEVFALECNECEITYLKWVLQVGIGREKSSVITAQNQILNENILKFIKYVEERMGINLSLDRELREGLYTHMDKALIRIRSNMQVENPALLEIKENYGELFQVVKDGVRKYFPKDYFPEDEVGYLVLYFALSLDKLTKRMFRVLVVCSGGMGSSKALASSLEREIPEIQVVKTLSMVALEKENLSDYDLILSTIPLDLSVESYLRVSPLLNKKEVMLIKEKIQRHKHSMLRKIDKTEKRQTVYGSEDNETVLDQIADICHLGQFMIEKFKFISYSESMDLRMDVLRTIQSYHFYREKGVLPQVENDSFFCLPMTTVMYYEGACRELEHPIIFAHTYDREEQSDHNLENDWNAALVVLYPVEMAAHEKKVLCYLVEAIIQERALVESVQKTRAEEVKNWIGFYIKEYLSNWLVER